MQKFKKNLKKLIIVLPMLAFLTAYTSIPENITVMQGQSVNLSWGITAGANTKNTGRYASSVKLFNLIPIKTVNVSVMPKYYVIPSGEAIGVKLHADGVLVVGMSDVTDKTGNIFAPAKDAGIRMGDRITHVNGEKVENTNDFVKRVNDADGKLTLRFMRKDEMLDVKFRAVYSGESRSYKVGLWVRDSTAGIGTLTFYDPENATFAALGHGICDSDTKELMVVKKGTVNGCNIRSVIKGENGVAGELLGDFSGKQIGTIISNSSSGIRGKCDNIPYRDAVEVASRFEVCEGKAQILCDIDGCGPKEYEIEITRISRAAHETNKNLVLKVTDLGLIEKTGGIVQGMSGSPIIQNGKLVGAVTHVLVNDPTRGYGIFIENMLDEASNTN